ncbi:MAG: DMT family transporter [Hyphomicrobiaceae bacterium]
MTAAGESAGARTPERDAILGLMLALLAQSLFSVQDAIVKWLVMDYAIFQVLLVRSVVVLVVTSLAAGTAGLAAARRSPSKRQHMMRATAVLVAWLCYYTAARKLHLAEMVTIYYAAPFFVTVLSVLILNERPGLMRWAAVGIGFVGVLIAANPTGRADLAPALLVLVAALLWAWSGILVRQIIRNEPSTTQLLFSNMLFALGCLPGVLGFGVVPSLGAFGLMVLLGLLSGLAQFVMLESYRRAPASVVAPVSYTSFLWALLFGWLIWGELPGTQVFVGAAIILSSGALAVIATRR